MRSPRHPGESRVLAGQARCGSIRARPSDRSRRAAAHDRRRVAGAHVDVRSVGYLAAAAGTGQHPIHTRSRVQVVARLAPSVTPRALADTLDAISRTSTTPMRAVTALAIAVAGDTTQLLALLGGGALVAALVAFTNLAGLLVVRAIDRRRELSLRQALGAPRLEIARQLLLEAATLVGAGAMGGVLVAWWATPVVDVSRSSNSAISPTARSRSVGPRFSYHHCGSGVGRRPVHSDSGDVDHTTTCRRHLAARCHGGATRTTAPPRVRDRRRVLRVRAARVDDAARPQSDRHAAERPRLRRRSGHDDAAVAARGGVSGRGTRGVVLRTPSVRVDRRLPAAAIANELPLTGDRGRAVVSLRPADAGPEAIVREVGTRYFDVMQIRLIAGRSFDGRDDLPAPPRAVVSQSLARRLFRSESPIGRRISMAPATRPFEIVGVVGDVTHRALDDPPRATLYLSAWQTDSRSRVIVVRDLRAQADVVAIVRDIVARSDRTLPVYGVRSMRGSSMRRRACRHGAS